MSKHAHPTDERMAEQARVSNRSQRGRKVMVVLLVFLFLLLCSASYLLLRFVQPAGDIARVEDAQGIEWVRSIYGWGTGSDQQLQQPAAVAFADDGSVLVPQVVGNSQVLRFGSDGNYRESFFGSEGEGRVLFPTGIAVGPDDHIYVIQSTQENLLKLSPDGTETLLKIDIQQPTAVAVSEDRIVVGAKAGFAILDSEGSPIKVVGTEGFDEDQFDTVSGIAIDGDGDIYVVDTYNNRISKYDAEGTRQWLVKTGNPANQAANEGAGSIKVETDAPAALQTPGAAVIDGAGRLVVVDTLDFSLTVFDTEDGAVIAKYGTYGTEEGTFLYPAGLAYDAERDWFAVGDLGNNRVQIVRLPGSSENVVLPAARRALTGSLRALFLPLILLIVGAAYWVYAKLRTKRHDRSTGRSAQ